MSLLINQHTTLLQFKLRTACYAGILTQSEVETIRRLVEFHDGAEVPTPYAQTFAALMDRKPGRILKVAAADLLFNALLDTLEYVEQREDADCVDGKMVGNEAMRLSQQMREALRAAGWEEDA